eukprot:6178586-Pleurochrysis_carterae.AAC.2
MHGHGMTEVNEELKKQCQKYVGRSCCDKFYIRLLLCCNCPCFTNTSSFVSAKSLQLGLCTLTGCGHLESISFLAVLLKRFSVNDLLMRCTNCRLPVSFVLQALRLCVAATPQMKVPRILQASTGSCYDSKCPTC